MRLSIVELVRSIVGCNFYCNDFTHTILSTINSNRFCHIVDNFVLLKMLLKNLRNVDNVENIVSVAFLPHFLWQVVVMKIKKIKYFSSSFLPPRNRCTRAKFNFATAKHLQVYRARSRSRKYWKYLAKLHFNWMQIKFAPLTSGASHLKMFCAATHSSLSLSLSLFES